MSITIPGGLHAGRRSKKSRRPWGISRRQRKRQLGFETLEDRRVMSAQSPLPELHAALSNDIQYEVQSYSSLTPGGQAQILANELYWQTLLANVAQLQAETNSIPTDPLSTDQWHLINTGQEVGNPDFQAIFGIPGQDINVAPVWNLGFTGAGVVVAVIDSGVETTHPDLAANISATLQLDALAGDGNPNPDNLLINPGNAHGTAVAGLIGAVADNGLGGSGVAPGVTLAPIRLIDVGQTEQAFIDAFRFAIQDIDITNNSWSPVVDVNADGITERGISGPTANQLLALRDSVIFGRKVLPGDTTGLGVIHVFAAGNAASSPFAEGFPGNGGLNPSELALDSAAYNGWVATRYTIGVTGVDHDGFYNNIDGSVTSYPETSTGVLVAAPTGSVSLLIGNDSGIGSGIVTTDTLGETGFNFAPDPVTGQEFDRDFEPDTDFTSRFNGTSAAAPLVSGIIALMLEANPNLSWRDVQEILVRSARQNSEFAVPAVATVPVEGGGITQNLWIQNQTSIFHDPDPFDPTVAPDIQTQAPTLDPNIIIDTFSDPDFPSIHYAPAPQTNTNGAGFTVSQGRGAYGEEIGYAHGVVDAELAVQLAQQWSTKNQVLPDELTFTANITPSDLFFIRLPAAEQTSADGSDSQIVPGSLGGQPGFVAFWDEYYQDDPFSDPDPPDNTRGVPINVSVPDNNTMTIETVEVKVSISGGTADALDSLRILLVSPEGTSHELNDYFVDDSFRLPEFTLQNDSRARFFTGGGTVPGTGDLSVDTNPGGNLVATFSSNRSWGERSDDALAFDATTGEPIDNIASFGGGIGQYFPDDSGLYLAQGWTIHMENYSPTFLQVDGLEVIWHGSPVGANTQRVQGVIGVDDNQDDAFNFSRVGLQVQDFFGDPSTLRQTNFLLEQAGVFEVRNVIDTTHESMAANVTVTARRASDGVIVDQFVTGADGNYYFDLVPDDYIISVEDALGRTALEDTQTPAGFLQDYRTEWEISADFFKVWERDAALEVPVDGNGVPLSFDGIFTPYHAKEINFLLDPGVAPLNQVNFTGVVFADLNGDGIFNGDDVHVPEVNVFGDVNRNGQFDAGEVIVQTDINGAYDLTVPNSATTVINVGVVAPPNWTFSEPDTGFSAFFVQPGAAFSDVDFAITPPPGTSAGDGSSQPGYLLGTVYEDINANGTREAGELGVSGIDVFIDSNNSGSFELGERITTTNVNGSFIFAAVPPGTHRVRIVTSSPLEQINPVPGGAQFVSLVGGGTVEGILFGIGNTAILDFGDLPAVYGVTLAVEDGARHSKGAYFLGTLSNDVDAELDGNPHDDALGDDLVGSDEDGITVDPLVAGAIGRLEATASRHGGNLQGWVDFNGDFDFDDVGERIITNEALVPGLNVVTFTIPATIEADRVFARFRYGEYGIDTVTGFAQIGEVEDHELEKAPLGPATVVHGPDFDDDGDVDGSDFLAWQRGFGATTGAAASDGDANSDGAVDEQDLADWGASFGDGVAAPAVLQTPDFDLDGDADGADFLAWQRGFGTEDIATLADGDGSLDGDVDASDLAIWQQGFGTIGGGGAVSAPVETASFAAGPIFTILTSDVQLATPAPLLVTSESAAVSADARSGAFAAVASEVHRRFASFAPIEARLELNLPVARFETTVVDRTVEIAHDLADLALARRAFADQDSALDRLFTGRRIARDYFELLRDHEADEEKAFSLALGEEIDWRFG